MQHIRVSYPHELDLLPEYTRIDKHEEKSDLMKKEEVRKDDDGKTIRIPCATALTFNFTRGHRTKMGEHESAEEGRE